MKKKLLSVLLAAAMILSLAACGGNDSGGSTTPAPDSGTAGSAPSESGDAGSAEAVHLTLAHADAADGSLFGECTKIFKEKVEEASGGSIIIDIFPNGQLGTVSEYVTGIQSGTIDLAPAVTSFVANFCPNVSVFEMPFLFEDHDHVWEALDGDVGATLSKDLTDNNIIPLIWWGIGFRNVTTSESHPINSLSDFKGFRIRTMQSVIQQSLFQALGADAVPMDWGELYTALQQGTVDGEENPYTQVFSSNIWEVNPVIVQTEHEFSPSVFMMSPAVEGKLSAEQLDIIYKCAEECKPLFRQSTIDINNDALKSLQDNGCTFIDTLDKAELQAATMSVYDQYPEYADLVASIRALRG